MRLLEVLDPAQNDSFTDHYLNVPFDLSEVLFIATANFLQNIPGPLLDRMEVVDFAGYTEREKAEIAKKYLIPRQLEESGLADQSMSVHRCRGRGHRQPVHPGKRRPPARAADRRGGQEAGAQAGRRRADRTRRSSPEAVRELLGRPKVHPEHAGETSEVGVATGMYYTPGRRRHHVRRGRHPQASRPAAPGRHCPWPAGLGNVSLILTGQLGDVMKESARAALTYAATHARALDIPDDQLGSIEVHVHVPAGAIPKDGPSAGVAMATAIVSAMSGQPVRSDVAMTGEITLRGRVLPIGGVKEKVLGAHRAGINHIILPKQNEADLEDLPADVRDVLIFHAVATLDEVFDLTLLPGAVAKPSSMEPVGSL